MLREWGIFPLIPAGAVITEVVTTLFTALGKLAGVLPDGGGGERTRPLGTPGSTSRGLRQQGVPLPKAAPRRHLEYNKEDAMEWYEYVLWFALGSLAVTAFHAFRGGKKRG